MSSIGKSESDRKLAILTIYIPRVLEIVVKREENIKISILHISLHRMKFAKEIVENPPLGNPFQAGYQLQYLMCLLHHKKVAHWSQ